MSSIKNFFIRNSLYFLSFAITYVIGGLLLGLVCVSKLDSYSDLEMCKLFLSYIMPSTVTFIFIGALNSLKKDNISIKDRNLWAIVFGIIYLIIYLFYEVLNQNMVMIWLAVVVTVLVLIFDLWRNASESSYSA